MQTTPPPRPRIRSFAPRALAAFLVVSVTALSSTPVALAEPAPDARPAQSIATDLVVRALGLLGVSYRWGGNSPESGLDCSGLVRHVFAEAAGLVLPRRSEEISRAGAPIPRSDLRPGDLVFFNTLRRTFSHVGIYIGEGRFVHAPSSGGAVRVEQLSGAYWASRFNGGRRLIEAEGADAGTPVYAASLGGAAASAAAAAAASATAAASAAVAVLSPSRADDRSRAIAPGALSGPPRAASARDSGAFLPHGSY